MAKRCRMSPLTDIRCQYVITLKDGSEAMCGRLRKKGDLCTQHHNIVERLSCEYCGGNDELPPDHCIDCARPVAAPAASGEEGV